MNKKRERQAALGDQNDQSVDDDEFDAYLDSLGGKKNENGLDDEEFDIAGSYGDGKSADAAEEDDEDWDSDGNDDDDDEIEGDDIGDGLVFKHNIFLERTFFL